MKLLVFIFSFLFSAHLFASSCCGGGSSSSLIITGDNRQEWSMGMSYRNDLGQTDNDGWASFHNDKTTDYQNALNLQYQNQLFDRFQLAAKSSFIQKVMNKQGRDESTYGLGDLDLQTTYEYLPEYTYSAYKPRGFVYGKVTIPNSKSLYDSRSVIFSDVRGSGLYAVSLGNLFLKKIGASTLKGGVELQHLFGRNFNQGQLSDYNKVIVPLGYAYDLDPIPLAIGFNSTWNYQTKKELRGDITLVSAKEYFWETGAFVNWVVDRNQTWGLNYSDSTLVGKNINSPLYRSVGLTYTHSTEL